MMCNLLHRAPFGVSIRTDADTSAERRGDDEDELTWEDDAFEGDLSVDVAVLDSAEASGTPEATNRSATDASSNDIRKSDSDADGSNMNERALSAPDGDHEEPQGSLGTGARDGAVAEDCSRPERERSPHRGDGGETNVAGETPSPPVSEESEWETIDPADVAPAPAGPGDA